MNPLSRILGTTLFVVLAVLAALLAVPVWRQVHPVPGTIATGGSTVEQKSPPRAAKLATFSQRTTLTLAVIGVALTTALLFSLALQPRPDTRAPFPAARHEMGTLAKLAETSVAQGEELSRERDVRRRAEEDAQLKQQLLADSVEEKIRLGRDLHDGIIQSLYAVGLTVESMRPLLHTNPEQAATRLEEIRNSLNTTIKDVRSYITGLAPENLRRASFSRMVATLFEQLRAGREVSLEVNVDESAAAILSTEQNLEALQIAREAISNALRHGAASQITLRMHEGDGEVCLLIHDNGRGFDATRSGTGGYGLGNMKARAERSGASLRVSSQPGQGVRVIATFPSQRTTST